MFEDNTGVASVARYRLWNSTHEQQRRRCGGDEVDRWSSGWPVGWDGERAAVHSTSPFIHLRAPTGAHKPVSAYTNAIKPGLKYSHESATTSVTGIERERVPRTPQPHVARPTKPHPPPFRTSLRLLFGS